MKQYLSIRLRSYFGFSQGQANAFLWLLGLMALLLLLPLLVRYLSPGFDPAPDAESLRKISESLQYVPEERRASHAYVTGSEAFRLPREALRPFDPNALTAQQWQAFGLRKNLAERIVKYRSKGGQFRNKEDLQRMYGFPDTLFQQLYPFISLPSREAFLAGRKNGYANDRPERYEPGKSAAARPGFAERKRAFVLEPVDLNLADTAELKRIRSIGTKRALRLVEYRERLGGFVSHEQLREIWALDSASIDSLRKYTYLENDFRPRQLNINTATADELRQHPFMRPNVAKALVSYREAHGPYGSVADIKKVKLVNEELYRKISLYLRVQ